MDKKYRIILLFVSFLSFAQTEVTISADTLEVRLAEQINLEIVIKSAKQARVQFPPFQEFIPFEVIDSSDIDTFISANLYTYTKTYKIIYFDPGQFTLPQQKLFIDGELFSTDSLIIQVNDIVVDTLEQPLFPIKTILPMIRNTTGWWKPYAIGFLIFSLLVCLYIFVIKTQKHIRSKRAKLPPFERAIQALHALEFKQLDKQEAYKDYYSEMTDIVRNYLDDETKIDALESTSDELILKMEMLRDSGNLKLSSETMEQLYDVLSTSDLVKFARALPEEHLARIDREKIESVVMDTQAALPEPSEEERLKNVVYAKKQRKKHLQRRIKIAAFSAFVALAVLATVMITNYGIVQSKDRLLGNPTLKLLQKEWIFSSYGISAMQFQAPDVLTRKITQNRLHQQFVLGSLEDTFMIVLNMEHSRSKDGETVNVQEKVDKVIGYFDSMGATNIFQKQNDYTTTLGIEGILASGSFDWVKDNQDSQRKNYEVYHFTENKGFQELQLIYDRNDRYAKDLIERILSSIKFDKVKS